DAALMSNRDADEVRITDVDRFRRDGRGDRTAVGDRSDLDVEADLLEVTQILGVPHLGRDVAGDGRHLHRDQLLRGQRTRKKQNERESKNETHAKNLRGTNNSADAQA